MALQGDNPYQQPNSAFTATGNNPNRPPGGANMPSTPPPIVPTTVNPVDIQQLINKASQGYVPAQPGYTVGGGSSIVQTGPSLAQIMQMLGLNNIQMPTLDNLTKQAQAQTNLTINPQEDALRNLIDQLNSSTSNQITAEDALGARQKSDIQDTFNRLLAFTNAATQAGLGGYDQAAQQIAAGNQQTAQALQNNQQNAQNATNAELNRLGLLGNGSTLSNTRIAQDANFLQGLAAADANNQLNNNAQAKAGYNSVQGLLSSGQQQAGASALTAADNQIAQALASINAAQQQGLTGYNNQIQSLEGTRAAQNQSNLAALQAAAQQQLQAQQQMLINAISAAASGQKVVSGGSTHVGSTAAQGISPEDAIKLLMSNSQNSQSNDQNTLNDTLKQQSNNISLANLLSGQNYAALNPQQQQSLLTLLGVQPQGQ